MRRSLNIALVGLSLLMTVTSVAAQVTASASIVDSVVQLPSGSVFYRDSGGAGIPVIFLHAGSGNSMLWEYQIPAFTDAGYRFIAIDYRGVNSAANVDATTYISELIALLKLERFHLVGTAAGGGTALQYALAHEEQLRSITVANSIGNVQDKDYTEMGSRMRPAEFNALPLELRELGPSYRAVNPAGAKRWLELSAQKPAAVITATAQPVTASTATASAAASVAVTWARLEKFTVPTLLITGAADLYTPPSVLRMFTEHMNHAEAQIIVESGHSAYWEDADQFNGMVLEFIDKY